MRHKYTPEQRITKAIRALVIARDGNICQYCGVSLDPRWPRRFYTDHVLPAALGGPAQLFNLVLACPDCNAQKGRRVWIPRNLAAITAEHPEWQQRIITLAQTHAKQVREPRTEYIGFVVTRAEKAAILARVPPGRDFSDWARAQLLGE